MDLRTFDLNLLVVLQALLIERSVSKTAERLNLSQPATSAALNRLRTALDDPILVREGLRMVPTPRAEELVEPIQAILAEIEQTIAKPTSFDPSTAQRTFRIATNDYGSFVLIPHFMKRLHAIAPLVDIEILEIGHPPETFLQEAKIDLVLADAWTLRECQCTETLFPETFTCLVRENHPRIQSELTLEHYLQENHALLSSRGRVTGNVDLALTPHRLERHVQITLPHILAIPAVVASTELVVTLATRVATRLAWDYALKTFPPPVFLDSFNIAIAWQKRMTADPALQWLRREFIAIGNFV